MGQGEESRTQGSGNRGAYLTQYAQPGWPKNIIPLLQASFSQL